MTHIKDYSSTLVVLVVWCGLVLTSLVSNVYSTREHTEALAMKEARSNFNKDKSFRLWGASHGGVYVPITKRTQPNPRLSHIPERDITTPSGVKLTLMNPAWMIRQIMNDYSRLYQGRGKITTFPEMLFNPKNAPDKWELASLYEFEGGKHETVAFTKINNEPYLRLMRPMFIEEPCLKCHAKQGYKVGELRGGVSVSVPMKEYYAEEHKQAQITVVSHGMIWLLGVAGIVIFGRRKRMATKKILESREQAIAANQAKTQFLANMSHELRTPLNAIIGFSEMIKSEIFGSVGSDRNKEYVHDIQMSGEHLLSVINDMLDVAQIEAGALDYIESEVDLAQVIEECIHLETARAVQGDLTIRSNIPEGIPSVRADVTRVKQILLNLLSNAIKFTPAGGTVLVQSEVRPDGEINVSVKDTGIGIKEDDISKVFEPFVQVENIFTRTHHGSGIGLSISKRLSALHGGELNIESELGVGTKATVTFPKERICGAVD
ncbi:MAG: ATP-binding protein [Magnetovibrio sp.]|nr:ATP-binding protein [Magnetovibrio sp.]